MTAATAAPINRIIPLSTVDGPGARAVVFLQGCNLSCAYCHNPETMRVCNSCGVCLRVCPAAALRLEKNAVLWDSHACTGCDACLGACPNFSSPKVRWMTPGVVMDELRKEKPFIRGVTVSGGECTLYTAFLTELFAMARAEGFHCLIDSNGTLNFEDQPDLLAVCDGVMLDIKAWDPAVYAKLTGAADNHVIKTNLALLADKGLLQEIRLVCLDKFVDATAVLHGAASVLGKKTAQTRLKLIAFRCIGVRGELANFPSPTDDYMLEIYRYAVDSGFREIVLV